MNNMDAVTKDNMHTELDSRKNGSYLILSYNTLRRTIRYYLIARLKVERGYSLPGKISPETPLVNPLIQTCVPIV